MGCHFLQGIFLTQESNLGLLHCRQILHHLSYEGSPCSVPPSLPFADAWLQFSGSAHKPGLLGRCQACLLRWSGESDFRSVLPLPRFLVFLRYQCYYEYPLLTYLEYPILIAQGNRPPSPWPASALSTSHTTLTQSLSFPDLILLLCVFHFNGDVRRAAPYIIAYPFSI